ncbi:MAG: hypothetical protein OQK24_03105 [Magnetovibrio sp.]|nr:hypothetical protein [Magnetovibrio sp.]
MSELEKTKEVLKAADDQIVQLSGHVRELEEYIESQAQVQQQAVKELDRLAQQMQKLDKALKDVSNERDDVRMLLDGLRSDMEKIRDVAAESLKSATDKQSILNMAAKFYDVKTLADSVKFIKD